MHYGVWVVKEKEKTKIIKYSDHYEHTTTPHNAPIDIPHIHTPIYNIHIYTCTDSHTGSTPRFSRPFASMADGDLSSPLLSSPLSENPHFVVNVVEGDDEQSSSSSGIGGDSCHRNPYEFLGSDWFDVPREQTLNPFRNHTEKIAGAYEWLKILLLLPIAAVRLVLFGTCLAVGYLATKLALYGWKDKHNPMPKWRCRFMWITRVSARCILFSFGWDFMEVSEIWNSFLSFICFVKLIGCGSAGFDLDRLVLVCLIGYGKRFSFDC